MTSIRLASSDDVDKLVEIDAELYGSDGYPHFSIKQYLDLFRNSFFVAERDKELIGYCIIGVEAFSTDGWLLSMAVRKSSQNAGVGRALMQAAEEYCVINPIDKCSLTVHPDNQAAVSLYQNHGYKIERTYPNYYKPSDPRLLMIKSYTSK